MEIVFTITNGISCSLLGTYDAIETTVEVDDSGVLLANTSFIDDTIATGVLYVIVFLNNYTEPNFCKSYYHTIPMSIAIEGIALQHILPGEYQLLTFDIESEDLIQQYGNPAHQTDSFQILTSHEEGE